MLFSEREHCQYARQSVNEVICQLRFPTILTIGKDEPAAFQDAIRADFPRYAVQQETPPKAADGTQPTAITNYSFLSADNLWKLNLTRGFLALSTLQYTDWETFAHLLDRSLVQFIRLYEPAFFERIGLRYVNIFSRSKLGVDGVPFSELFSPAYLGPLAEQDVREENLIKCALDLDLKLDSSCVAKIHAGPGRLKANTPNTPDDPELKFILDLDVSMGDNIPIMLAAGGLETLHGHSTRLFEGAITDRLRGAMQAKK